MLKSSNLTNIKEQKVAADDATPTYESEVFTITKQDGTTYVGDQQDNIITVPEAGFNNANWIGTITKDCFRI